MLAPSTEQERPGALLLLEVVGASVLKNGERDSDLGGCAKELLQTQPESPVASAPFKVQIPQYQIVPPQPSAPGTAHHSTLKTESVDPQQQTAHAAGP
jgi:hypothetical protein